MGGENQSIFLYHPPCRGAPVSLIFTTIGTGLLLPVQVRGAYIKLRALASQGCKEQFIIESAGTRR